MHGHDLDLDQASSSDTWHVPMRDLQYSTQFERQESSMHAPLSCLRSARISNTSFTKQKDGPPSRSSPDLTHYIYEIHKILQNHNDPKWYI
jgi:hypothetical protein